MNRESKPEDVLNILIKSRNLINEEDKWVKGTGSIDKHGEPTAYKENNAVAFCALSSIYRACDCDDEYDDHQIYYVLNKIGRALNAENPNYPVENTTYYANYLVSFNDNPETSHKMIMNVFDTAIESERKSLVERGLL